MSLDNKGPGGVAPRSSVFSLDDSSEGESGRVSRSSTEKASSEDCDSLQRTASDSSALWRERGRHVR